MEQSIQGEEKTPQPYLGDLDKTRQIDVLVKVLQSDRDEIWNQAFLANVTQASFCCGEPQVITGPDGFPYFQLFLPEPNKSFQCYVIENMKDDFLLATGLGVVINPGSDSADWVLSNGDIVNLHLNNSFYTTGQTSFSNRNGVETLTESEEVMVGQPNEKLLPASTRKLLREYLNRIGMPEPKVLLLMRKLKDGTGVSQDLVFNVTPDLFEDEKGYRAVMRTIAWYLPRHYSFVGMSEETLGTDFMPL